VFQSVQVEDFRAWKGFACPSLAAEGLPAASTAFEARGLRLDQVRLRQCDSRDEHDV